MKTWKLLPALLVAGAAVMAADPPKADKADKTDAGSLVVVDAAGKEQKLKSWKFVAGIRHLGWLAPAPKPDEKDKPDEKPADRPARPAAKPPAAGPEALEFRDENSTTLVQGILTLIALDHLKAVEYDADKKSATVRVNIGEKADDDLTITGPTQYEGINKLTIEAEVDKGEAGIAEVKFLGGSAKGVKAVRFPSPKPAAEVKGRPAFVGVDDKGKKHTEQVFDLQPLYALADGSEKLAPTLMFKKTLKLDVAKIARLKAGEGRDEEGSEWQVTMKDGEETTYTLLNKATIDGKEATLEGLVGKVRGGYKLFPARTLASMRLDVQFDEQKDKGEEKP
jgi:hypothetical protein